MPHWTKPHGPTAKTKPACEVEEAAEFDEAEYLFHEIDCYREELEDLIRVTNSKASSFFEQGYLAGLLMARQLMEDYVGKPDTRGK